MKDTIQTHDKGRETYNFCESVEGLAVLARQHSDLRVGSGDDVFAQYYYVCVAPSGALVDDIKFVKEILHISINVVVDSSHGFLRLLLSRNFAFFNADNADEVQNLI